MGSWGASLFNGQAYDHRGTQLYRPIHRPYGAGAQQIHRIILSGANLAELGSTSIAYNGGQGGLLSLMRGSEEFAYVSNQDTIFSVTPQ